ncbi:hypothetical protein ColTof4_14080 [Colletotrichum tofieldiae]|nr:hypothetical protein ColTof3_14718 [Colletotrichum tofieldiae]GKT81657.1 hypothetical protein ColTof4_14080 [Colletotrichum tofieldiae]
MEAAIVLGQQKRHHGPKASVASHLSWCRAKDVFGLVARGLAPMVLQVSRPGADSVFEKAIPATNGLPPKGLEN